MNAQIQVPDFLDPKKVLAAFETVKAGPLKDKLFAGHFTIGPAVAKAPLEWAQQPLGGGLILSSHPDVPVTHHVGSDVELCLIGDVVSWRDPEASNQALVQKLCEDAKSVSEVIELTSCLSGRWALFARSATETIVFADAWGSRFVCYGTDRDGRFWVSSSPKLITWADPDCLDYTFIREILPVIQSRPAGSQYPYDLTPYKTVRAMLPNHSVDVLGQQANRYWPVRPLQQHKMEDVVEKAATQFSGALRALSLRQPIVFGLTGGTDSRLVLGATLAEDIEYKCFTAVSKKLVDNEDHFDVTISKQIAQSLDLNHELIYSTEESLEEVNTLFTACSTMPNEVMHRMISAFTSWPYKDRLHVISWGSEINRRFWDIPDRDDPFFRDIVGCIGFSDNELAMKAVRPWVEDLWRFRKDYGIKEFDLAYWECRMARWGSETFNDINLIQKTIPAYNCRDWFELVLGTTQSQNAKIVKLYHDMTHHLDPRLSEFPQNPFPLGHRLRELRKVFPKMVLRTILKATGQYRRVKAWRNRHH